MLTKGQGQMNGVYALDQGEMSCTCSSPQYSSNMMTRGKTCLPRGSEIPLRVIPTFPTTSFLQPAGSHSQSSYSSFLASTIIPFQSISSFSSSRLQSSSCLSIHLSPPRNQLEYCSGSNRIWAQNRQPIVLKDINFRIGSVPNTSELYSTSNQ